MMTFKAKRSKAGKHCSWQARSISSGQALLAIQQMIPVLSVAIALKPIRYHMITNRSVICQVTTTPPRPSFEIRARMR